MAITDKLHVFDDNATRDVAAATPEYSTISWDMGPLSAGNITSKVDIAAGEQLCLMYQVGTAFASAGSATLKISVISDPDEDTLDASSTVHVSTPAIPKATLAAGHVGYLPLPPGEDYERYIGVSYTAATADFSGGTITTSLVLAPAKIKQYDSGLNFA